MLAENGQETNVLYERAETTEEIYYSATYESVCKVTPKCNTLHIWFLK